MKAMSDGIYVGLSFEDYLAIPRVSSGDLFTLQEGPPAYWADRLDPDKEQADDTTAQLLGKAHHCARLEPEEFDKRFVRDIDLADYPDGILTTGAQIEEALAALGHPKTQKGELVMDKARRLAAVTSKIPIMHIERERFELETRQGRDVLAPKDYDTIKREAAWVHQNPEIHDMISGGIPELTVLFTEPTTGTKCKIRPDYVKGGNILHLKTWDAKGRGQPANETIANRFMYDGHYLIGWFYHVGMSRIAADGLAVKHHNGKDNIQRLADLGAATKATIEALQSNEREIQTGFLYIRRGGIPDLRFRSVKYFDLPPGVEEQKIEARKMAFRKQPTLLGRKADGEMIEALLSIKENTELFGAGPWFPRDMIGTFEDDDFREFWLDNIRRVR